MHTGSPQTVVVDALPVIRSPRFDLPLTYETGALALDVGHIVRVPLGNREVLAYVISPPRQAARNGAPLKPVLARSPGPRAFNAVGLALAQFISERYICSLAEALSAVVLAAALPRTVDRFARSAEQPPAERVKSVPLAVLELIWDEFEDGFTLDQLLRHPHARRAGDRAQLLGHVAALVRGEYLRRERLFLEPRVHEYTLTMLFPGNAAIKGRKAAALAAFVAEAGSVPRADALLAGFSNAVIARAIKAGAIEAREIIPQRQAHAAIAPAEFTATGEQAAALETLRSALGRAEFSEVLMHGITGSGKTFVYVEAIKRVLQAGGRAIVLVPEISLTPQTAGRFERAFGGRVAVLHSALSDRERYDAWQACADGQIDVVVGARSAVFAPLENVRLLVVDEAHETSYKQDTSPRYNAVSVARRRMQLEGGVLVLGSATPSLESYEAALRGRTTYVHLKERATQLPLPAVEIVNMTTEFEAGNRRIFSTSLTQALGQRLEAGEKTVLFVNRRGSAGFLLCRACGFVPECDRCSVSLTVHRTEGILRCHYCDRQAPIPQACASCGQESIREFGVGTQRVAQEVSRLFPAARIVRMDSDTTTRLGDHARLLDEFGERADVLVGTQMVAKGLDFPQVTLVGVIAADIGLHAAEFRASERTFDLITQVCGRSGRARAGQAVVQTYAPSHPAIAFAAMHDYIGFAEHELRSRRELGYPPYGALIYLGIIGRSRPAVIANAQAYANILNAREGVEVLGPAPYPIARMNDEWRYRIALKTRQPRALRDAIRELVLPVAHKERATRLAINVDP